MKSRLDRYEDFLRAGYRDGFRKPHEYSVAEVRPELRGRLAAREFRRVVFTGMGCSAIVAEVVRGYFQACDSDVEVHVVNDYDFRCLLPRSVVQDDGTLIIVSSYSGHSAEPLRVAAQFREARDRLLLLTSGGRLAAFGEEHGLSVARWRLSNPDREYPLLHVPQYFAILMTMFVELGLLAPAQAPELDKLPGRLENAFDADRDGLAGLIAERSRDANIVMLASPQWHESLLKLCKMHFNEIAMAPATRNYLHEFCHSEVATLTHPSRAHSVLVFADACDDDYTKHKRQNLMGLLTTSVEENHNTTVTAIDLEHRDFVLDYFATLELIQHATLRLGRLYDTRSRDLISSAAGNAWYHSSTIHREIDEGATVA